MTNIIETGTYTINSIEINMLDRAHRTSGKFSKNVSEFDTCDFQEEMLENFPSPFVMESEIKIGMQFIETFFLSFVKFLIKCNKAIESIPPDKPSINLLLLLIFFNNLLK